MMSFLEKIDLSYLLEELNLNHKNIKKICIFGVGNLGIEMYYELKMKSINVDFFCDNDLKKHGHIIYNINCISIEELKKYRDETLVIICINSFSIESVEKQLKENNFKYFIKNNDVDKIFNRDNKFNLIDIDYSTKEAQTLINEFKNAVFDVCNYYENKKQEIIK